jgi:hypothetical protein
MPVLNASALTAGNLEGADHGATISLILDRSRARPRGVGADLHPRQPDDGDRVA